MDELVFRSSQKLDYLQIQLSLIASQSKDLFHQYSEQIKDLILQVLNNPRSLELQNSVRKLLQCLLELVDNIRSKVQLYINPKEIFISVVQLFGNRWTRRDIYIGLGGFVLGSVIGVTFGLAYRKNYSPTRYMQSIQCRYYLGPESVVVVEDTIAPHECGDDEILVDVKAASVQIQDSYISNGYGKTLRKYLRWYCENSKPELPVSLGRDCTGIVTDIGKNVTRIEIGDEVWLTMPFWAQGTMSQTIAVSEMRVAKKPKNIGFEGACSIPYAGCLALNALNKTNITFENAQDKRVLVHRGCTPVGCALIQILKYWGADVTSTCSKRASPVAKALGSDDIIIIEHNSDDPQKEYKTMIKELELRDKFDSILLTAECDVSNEELRKYCENKSIVTTMPNELESDFYGFFRKCLLGFYIRFQWWFGVISSNSSNQYDEFHMCHSTLDELSDLVKNGHLQTVVDKVFQPQDIDLALLHIQSSKSIGSTVITFR